MYTAINSKGGRNNGGLVYCFYFVMLTLCGDYTLLNVFLAIACDSLDQAAALTEAEEAEKEVRGKTRNSFSSSLLPSQMAEAAAAPCSSSSYWNCITFSEYCWIQRLKFNLFSPFFCQLFLSQRTYVSVAVFLDRHHFRDAQLNNAL